MPNRFLMALYAHATGDKHCGGCPESYPRECKQPGCPGLVHAEYIDYGAGFDAQFYCDTCSAAEGEFYEESHPSWFAYPRDRAASLPTPPIPRAVWKQAPDSAEYLYFAFYLGKKLLPSCFATDYKAIHIVGDGECPNCKDPPSPCQLPGCHGLVHSAQRFDDETLLTSRIEKQCEVCGDIVRLWGLSAEYFVKIQDRHRKEKMEREEKYRREHNPTIAEKLYDLLEYARKQIEEGTPAGSDRRVQWDSGALDISFIFSPRTVQTLFSDEGRPELFGLLESKMKDQPNDIPLRAAGISLYWRLSRLYPGCQELSWRIDDISGEFEEAPEWVTDTSEKWTPRREEFRCYLSKLVRLVDLQMCTEWPRTLWEIRSACAARDWYWARKLFEHARKENQCPLSELIPLQAHFEYRVVFGPEIDSKLGLGDGKMVLPKWRYVHEARLWPELSLDTLFVPLDHMNKAMYGAESSAADLQFIWGALQDEMPSITSEQHYATTVVARELNETIDKLGPLQDFYRSILAQSWEVVGELQKAADAYRVLAERSEPEATRWSTLFAKKAASLYVQVKDDGEAQNVLECSLSKRPDDIQILHELIKLEVTGGGDLSKAQSHAADLSRLIKEEHRPPEMRLLMLIRQSIVPQAAVDEEFQKWPPSASLCPSSKDAFETALHHQLGAAANQSRRDSDLRTAAFYFSKAVERQLREKVFEPFRDQILNSQQRDPLMNRRGAPDKFLNSYVNGNERIALGQMMNSMVFVQTLNCYVQRLFPRLSSKATLARMKQLVDIHGDEGHESLDPQLAAQAWELAKSVIEAMN